MTDDERLELFGLLLSAFRGAGLGWVCDEVLALIAHGIETQVPISEWSGPGKPKKSEQRTTRRELLPLERVELLIESVARVIRDGSAIELAVRDFFVSEAALSQATASETSSKEEPPSEIIFRPQAGPDDETGRVFTLPNLDQLGERSGAATTLIAVLYLARDQARQ